MATQELTANGSMSITANGTTRVNGSLTWTKPAIPADGVIQSVNVSGTYTWGGKGSFTLTINEHQITSNMTFDINLPTSVTSPYTITGVGGNRNATGANCIFTNLKITYIVDLPSSEQLMIKVNGAWTEVQEVYKKINGVWVSQTDLQTVFGVNTNYVKAN